MSAYDFMRIIVFFDLPVKTRTDKRMYRHFRKYLIRNGHRMLQYSVYSKILNNREAVKNHIKQIEKHVPKKGNIRLMTVTEKQYSNIKIIVGGKTYHEQILTVDPFVKY